MTGIFNFTSGSSFTQRINGMRKMGSLLVFLIIGLAGAPVSAGHRQGPDLFGASSGVHYLQLACGDDCSSGQEGSGSGNVWGDGIFGRRELNVFEKREIERKEKAKEKRARERKFIVPPLPNIQSEPWQMEKKDFIDWIGSEAYDKICGPVGHALKSTKEKYEKLRDDLTNFAVKWNLIWYRGAKGHLDNPDDDGHPDKYWNDTFGEDGEGERSEKERKEKAADEIKGHFQ